MPAAFVTHPVLDALFEQQAVGVALVDRDLRYVRINESLARLNGAPVDAHIGRRVDEMLPADFAVAAETMLESVLAGRPVLDQERSVPGPGGASRRFTFSY